MYHRMYIRRCSMSSISEESETGDDEHLDDEFIVCNNDNQNHHHEPKDQSGTSLSVNNCLGDLNAFKQVRISFALSTLYFLSTNQQISSSMKQKDVCLMISVSLHFQKLVHILYEPQRYSFTLLLFASPLVRMTIHMCTTASYCHIWI